MTFIIQQTLLYAVPLMIVALAGVFAERSGIINLALEGIMIFGAFIGVLFVRTMQNFDVFTEAARAGDWLTLQGLELLAMLVAAALGVVFSLLLSFASINLKADQTIGGTALNGGIDGIALGIASHSCIVRIDIGQHTTTTTQRGNITQSLSRLNTLGHILLDARIGGKITIYQLFGFGSRDIETCGQSKCRYTIYNTKIDGLCARAHLRGDHKRHYAKHLGRGLRMDIPPV